MTPKELIKTMPDLPAADDKERHHKVGVWLDSLTDTDTPDWTVAPGAVRAIFNDLDLMDAFYGALDAANAIAIKLDRIMKLSGPVDAAKLLAFTASFPQALDGVKAKIVELCTPPKLTVMEDAGLTKPANYSKVVDEACTEGGG